MNLERERIMNGPKQLSELDLGKIRMSMLLTMTILIFLLIIQI
jgi:hypothetical protein